MIESGIAPTGEGDSEALQQLMEYIENNVRKSKVYDISAEIARMGEVVNKDIKGTADDILSYFGDVDAGDAKRALAAAFTQCPACGAEVFDVTDEDGKHFCLKCSNRW
jgi:hypothetical protein